MWGLYLIKKACCKRLAFFITLNSLVKKNKQFEANNAILYHYKKYLDSFRLLYKVF
jgi:hypothetical protein